MTNVCECSMLSPPIPKQEQCDASPHDTAKGKMGRWEGKENMVFVVCGRESRHREREGGKARKTRCCGTRERKGGKARVHD